jgi:acetate---CoA ligase (ADP-forming)
VLRDGSTLHVRPSTLEDVPRLRAFLAGLSEESRWFRFFSAGVNLDAAARSAAAPDGLSLIALRGSEGAVVAHGTYICEAPGRAEVAFAVADAWHGHGIATVLLAHLAHAASAAGVETFTATVLPGNHRMLGVFHESGFLISARRSEDAIKIEFPTSLSRDARQRFEERQREADVAAVEHVLRPSSVAVIGASRRLGTVGGEVVRNLIAAGFSGSLHLVNVHGGEVAGRPTVHSIGDVEGEVELAVIVVPANAVVDVARACAAKGVRALVVLTAGFAELGPAGRARQDELLAVCRAAGMRMVGPNSLGVASPRPEIALNATVAPAAPSPGDVAFASQSGGFGSAAIDAAAARGIGFSSFVTMGDKADLSGSDFLEYWEQDPDTAVLLLYLDSFGNPRRFGRVARRITTAKPIVAVKSARTAGRRAPSSRTGALLAAADVTVDALFAHAGVLRAATVGEMFDVAGLLARQPLPPGDRVAVLTNAWGPGIACEDACQAAGLRVQPLSHATRKRLAEGLGAEVSTANPVDMTASATADQYERSLRVLLDDEAVDAVVTVFVRPLAARAAEVARGIAAAAHGADRPVLAVWLGADAPSAADAGVVPRFNTPEEAVRALAHAVRHARRRTAPPDPAYEPADADTATAATTVAEGLGHGGGWLAPGDVEHLLSCWGIPVVASRPARSARAAGQAAAELGGPIALKGVAPGLINRSDAGAVRLGLAGPTAVRRAAGLMARDLAAAGTTLEGFHVQRMAPAGPELIVGAVSDPAFGPLVACGAGGLTAELVGDIQVRLAPLGPREADGMLRDLKTFPLLDGYRGLPRADLGSVRDLVMRVGALVAAHPAVAELDLSPVIATPEGALVVGGRVRVDAPGPAATFPSLSA